MNPTFLRTLLALAAVCGLALQPAALSAQKALVYCPVGLDTSGCNTVVNALTTGGGFPEGVHRAYDGSSGTLDLATADLGGYAVMVIPSLSDNRPRQPYALLRSEAVRANLSAVFTGRVAVWSGTPDQGSANREEKNTLLRNLAGYAAAEAAISGENYATTGTPGLVVLQDQSVDASERYDWLAGISGRSITPDTRTKAFGRVRALNEAAGAVLRGANGNQLAYTNMASFGLSLPEGSNWEAAAEGVEDVAFYGRSSAGTMGLSVIGVWNRIRELWTATFSVGRVTFATSHSTHNSSAGSSLKITAPAVPAGGGVLIAQITLRVDGGTVTSICAPSAEWVALDRRTVSGKISQEIFRRVANDAEVETDYTWTFRSGANCTGSTVNTHASGAITAYTGVDKSTPTGGVNFTVGSSSTNSPQAPAVASAAQGDYVLRFFGVFNNTAVNVGSSSISPTPTRIYSLQQSNNARSLGAFEATQAANGTTGTFTASTNGGEYIAHTIVLRLGPAATGPTKLAFTTSAHSGTVGQCLGAITVQTQNASDAATNVTSNTTVNLATNGSGAFFSDSGCTTSVSSVVINSGSHSATFYYLASARGTASHQLTASAGALSSANQTQTIARAEQTTLTVTAPTSGTYGDKLTMSASGGSTGGTITFAVTAGSDACSILTAPDPDAGKLHITSGTGTCQITATRAGDDDYNAVTSAAQTVTIAKKGLTVTADDETISFGDATPGFAVSYDGFVSPDNASSLGGTLAFSFAGTGSTSYGPSSTAPTGAGTYSITPSGYSSDDYSFTYEAGSFTINAATPNFSFDLSALGAKTYGDASFSVASFASSSNSSGAITFGLGSGSVGCTVTSAGQVTITGAATGASRCIIEASLAAAGNYSAAGPLSQEFDIAPATPTVSITWTGGSYTGSAYSVSASSVSGVGSPAENLGSPTLTYYNAAAVADTLPGNRRGDAPTDAGSYTVVGYYSGNSNYTAAIGHASIGITQVSQSVSFAAGTPASKTIGDADFTVSATATSGLTVSFAAEAGSTCTVTDNGDGSAEVSGLAVGDCVVVASQAGNTNYTAAADVEHTISIGKATPAVTALSAGGTYGGTVTLRGTVNPQLSGGGSFEIAGTAVAGTATYNSATSQWELANVALTRAAGQYNLRKTFTPSGADADSYNGGDHTLTNGLTVSKATAEVAYTGDTYVETSGSSALVTLSALVTNVDPDSPNGNIQLATVCFTLTPASGGSTQSACNVSVNAAGVAQTTMSRPLGGYSVDVRVQSSNQYWTSNWDEAEITVAENTSKDQRVAGGGWIGSVGNKANFGFTIYRAKNGNLRGNFTYIYRAADGYNYRVKSTSLAGHTMTYTRVDGQDARGSFTAQANVQRINRATGEVESLGGNHTISVIVFDGDLYRPRRADTFQINVNGSWTHQNGVAELGGGNVKVQAK